MPRANQPPSERSLKKGVRAPLTPYLVIRRLRDQKVPGLRDDKYNALADRAGEIGADDFNIPDPWAAPVVSQAAE
jgi:hypothetical protein